MRGRVRNHEKMATPLFKTSRSWRTTSTSCLLMPEAAMLFFQVRLVAFAGKCLLRLRPQLLAPLVQYALRNPQVAGNLGDRLLVTLAQMHRFQLEVPGVAPRTPLLFCHSPCPLREVCSLSFL